MAEINGYIYSRAWFTFVSENRELVKPTHTALFFWVAELWNRLGQPKTFGLPTSEAQHHTCISSHTTFASALNDLTEWGFLTINHKSKNQYSANIVSICLPKNWQSNLKAKAKHVTKHDTKQLNSIVDIIEPLEPLRTNKGFFTKPTWNEVGNYIYDKLKDKNPDKGKIQIQANSFVDYYESKGWVVGKSPMKNWQAAVNRWILDKDLTAPVTQKVKYHGEE